MWNSLDAMRALLLLSGLATLNRQRGRACAVGLSRELETG
jgi:hypothetical protein